MNKIEFRYRNKTYKRDYAASWDELSARALIAYADAVCKGLSGINLVMTVLFKWLKLPAPAFFNINKSELDDLAGTLQFLFDKKISTSKLILQKIRHRGRTYFGPGEEWCNLTVAEYSYAEGMYDAFAETKEDKYLHNLIACLYRPTNA